MNEDWLKDGRKIPDDVMFYLRAIAVDAVRNRGESPETVVRVFNFNRPCIYQWLKAYDRGGFDALESTMPPGATPLIDDAMEHWLKRTVLEKTPGEYGYDTTLWTCGILADLLLQIFDVTVSESAVRLHLKKLGLSYQKPKYQDVKRDEAEIRSFLDVKFPKIQRLAVKLGAEIGFQDESGVGVTTRYGRTWGLRGHTPVVPVSRERGGCNVLSVITAQGTLRYSVKDENVNSEVFIGFLKELIRNRKRPLILLVDHASFHRSKSVRDFVRAHRTRLRLFFLPRRAPEFNPDEQVWNDIKTHRIGKQPVKNKKDLKKRLRSALASLQKKTERIISFFQLPETQYAAQYEA